MGLTNNPPLVYIVILIYNNKEEIKRCIESLEQITYTNYRILLIDNDSPDGGGSELKTIFSTFEFIETGENLGFARGCNVGLRYAVENNAEYVLLLNGDMIVESNFLEPMVEMMESNEDAGLASGKIFHLSNRKLLWYAGGYIQLWRGQLINSYYNKPDTIGNGSAILTQFCTGAMMLIPKRIINEIGLLPQEYFFGVEEWDYSMQVRQSGYKLYVIPNAVAYHLAGGSVKDYVVKFHYNFYRNKLIFQRKYLPRPIYWIWKMAFLLYVNFLLPVRTPLIHSDKIHPKSMVFAARNALADQKGLDSICWQELLNFRI